MAQPSMRWNASKAGMPPGAAVHLGERRTEEVSVQTVWFSADNVRVTPAMSLDAPPDAASTAWVQVTGLHDPEAVGEVARHFGLDDLLVEDILNTGHRPKVVIEDGFVVLIMKQLRWNPGLRRVDAEQVTLVLSARGLLTLTEGPTDAIQALTDRLLDPRRSLRTRPAAHLFYRLLDLWVDEYYTAVEALTVASERIESLVLQRPRPAALEELHRIRLAVLPARRMLHPLREALFKLQTDDRGWFPYETDRYLSDVAEHLTAVNEQLDALREHLAQTFDLYQSGISSRTNQVMQVLTIIATIFIPLTFVVGVYGMNFKYMPELQWRYGYAAVWAVMVLISGGMLLYFRRKRWM
ncbi:MAG: hypothetical protein RJA19_133 [Bacteroidota bacterium]|jgi:magnesium transporter